MRRPLLCFLAGAMASQAAAQSTQREAFDQGKAYLDETARIGASISADAAADIPGRDPAREDALRNIYGAPLAAAGAAKVADCAAVASGASAYEHQECDTINYVRRNPALRPRMAISRDEPALVVGAVARDAPRAFTGDQPGLSGTYSACVDRTTRTPLQYQTERCLVGHAVTEGTCQRTLQLSYRWQAFTGQPGAELAHARCASGLVRGDRLALPAATRYRSVDVPCAARGHGTGTEHLVMHMDCGGVEQLHGYDARRCSMPPQPALLDLPRRVPQCTAMPRTAEHCFQTDGTYAGKAEVPVFEEHWDDSDCADLDRLRGAVTD